MSNLGLPQWAWRASSGNQPLVGVAGYVKVIRRVAGTARCGHISVFIRYANSLPLEDYCHSNKEIAQGARSDLAAALALLLVVPWKNAVSESI